MHTNFMNQMPLQINNQIFSRIVAGQAHGQDWKTFSNADWDMFVASARLEGVAPLLYWHLNKSDEFSIFPEAVRNSLRILYSKTWTNNQRILRELERLSGLYSQAGIPLVVLKGACFCLTVYPDIGLRPMGDLDILVQKDNLAKAVEIARKFGYADAIPEASPGLNDLLSHHVRLQKSAQHSVTLEIHDSLVADKSFAYAVPVNWFWHQTEPILDSGQFKFSTIQMLSPEAQILFASAHAMLQHGGKSVPLRWLYDLDRLIRVYSHRLNWDLILSQSKKFDWSSALNAALIQIHAYFATPIPEYVRIHLAEQSDRFQDLVSLLQTRPATHILEERQKILSLSWSGRFRLIAALLFPTPAYMKWRYQLKGNWILPVYYLIRWGKVLRDLFKTIFHLTKKFSSLKA